MVFKHEQPIVQYSIAILTEGRPGKVASKTKRHQLERQKGRCLTNLRFEDDVLLFSTSLSKLEKMMCDFKGLEIHPNKTKILSNQNSAKRREVTIVNIKKEVQKSESARYLGQKSFF